MKRRTDIVDQYKDMADNYDRGFQHYLKTGWEGYLESKIPSDDDPNGLGPIGKANASGLLIDPGHEYELSVNIWQNGSREARELCEEWAQREEWKEAHLCPLTFTNIYAHVTQCEGVACAYWNWWHGIDGPCMLVREPTE